MIGTQPVPSQHRRSTRSSSTGVEGATKVKKAKRISNSYTVLVVEEPVPLSGVCVWVDVGACVWGGGCMCMGGLWIHVCVGGWMWVHVCGGACTCGELWIHVCVGGGGGCMCVGGHVHVGGLWMHVRVCLWCVSGNY